MVQLTAVEVMHGPIGQNVSNVFEKLICGGGWVPMSSGSICHFLNKQTRNQLVEYTHMLVDLDYLT